MVFATRPTEKGEVNKQTPWDNKGELDPGS